MSRGCGGWTRNRSGRAAGRGSAPHGRGGAPPRARRAGWGRPRMGESALLLEAGAALVVERALVRDEAFLPAGQEYGVELEPLGRVHGHDPDGFAAFAPVGVHDKRDVLEEALQVLELLHGADELLEVFQP